MNEHELEHLRIFVLGAFAGAVLALVVVFSFVFPYSPAAWKAGYDEAVERELESFEADRKRHEEAMYGH